LAENAGLVQRRAEIMHDFKGIVRAEKSH
jgi:hypothetical protein